MISLGATTVWEKWDFKDGNGMNSHNHPAYTSVGAWLYKELAGIRMAEDTTSYRNIVITPGIFGDLNWVKSSILTIRGRISVSWEIVTYPSTTLALNVTIPGNTIATVNIPTDYFSGNGPSVRESDFVIWSKGLYMPGDPGVISGVSANGYVTFKVGSGMYNFFAFSP
eukprot:TRINITY_DN6854_c0_g2_i1.p1 TRINITY_DN6854_c0_g2~~TRINITY_DN6854_c0_g2_i1.p1  ORF type:complete len:168 (+),score=24.93 TRINITY_DN6854_c0_g2_i1:108-611(+)